MPEEGALPVAGWLLDQGEAARAERLLDTISPFFDRLRFYPFPAGTPLRDDESVLHSAGGRCRILAAGEGTQASC